MSSSLAYGCRRCGHVWYVGSALQRPNNPALCGRCGHPGERMINTSDGAHPDSPYGPVGIVLEDGASGEIRNGVIENASVGVRLRGGSHANVVNVEAVNVPYALELREQSRIDGNNLAHRAPDK